MWLISAFDGYYIPQLVIPSFKMTYIVTSSMVQQWPLIATAVLVPMLLFLVRPLKRTMELWRLPLAGHDKWNYETRRMEYLTRAEKVYAEGYLKVLPIEFLGLLSC